MIKLSLWAQRNINGTASDWNHYSLVLNVSTLSTDTVIDVECHQNTLSTQNNVIIQTDTLVKSIDFKDEASVGSDMKKAMSDALERVCNLRKATTRKYVQKIERSNKCETEVC